ncbi:cellulose binding domain-containing protein [Cellulomonas sp. B6]|uniref:cellulose binding domain-containing protein n=1 Tax=Cellulomonas sp. B6 TaxID=1295626 RepID=UPI00073BF6E4|nr:cellulose binding domain-containing protein [Cellulomonas sp. B6]KSW14103.1 cellulose-binding protein [Cellulomonas sp. B6]
MSAQRLLRTWSHVLAVLLTGAALVAAPSAAQAVATRAPTTQAITPGGEPAPVTGNATWFDNLGAPYGGCGLPQDQLETQNWIALNVFHTPGDYAMYPRPMAAGDPKIGMWDNGRNCGRWVRVTIDDYCTGLNDGAAGQAFCRNGAWVEDRYNGATLDMLVADSCGDPNAWCRDDPYHLDLAHAAINRFVKDGAAVGDLEPAHWGNRKVSWEFIEAPHYTGDIEIGFIQGSERWWAGVSINHLPNGIHGVEHYADGAWVTTPMNTDMGQSFLVKPTTAGGTDYRIRVKDVTDAYLFGGREYAFSLPTACGGKCSAPRTVVPYTTSGGDGTTPTPTPTVSPTATPTPTPTPTVTPTPTPTVTPTPTTTPTPGAACTATFRAVSTWSGGYQGEVTVTAGAAALTSWRVTLTGATVSTLWNGVQAASGTSVVVSNAPYNGALAAGGTTTFGFIATGTPGTPQVTCAS